MPRKEKEYEELKQEFVRMGKQFDLEEKDAFQAAKKAIEEGEDVIGEDEDDAEE